MVPIVLLRMSWINRSWSTVCRRWAFRTLAIDPLWPSAKINHLVEGLVNIGANKLVKYVDHVLQFALMSMLKLKSYVGN
jgi:hypothetical protein